jgi:hypothetical protein
MSFGGWGGESSILEEALRRKQEEEERARQAAAAAAAQAALAAQRAGERDSWASALANKPPAFAPQPQPPVQGPPQRPQPLATPSFAPQPPVQRSHPNLLRQPDAPPQAPPQAPTAAQLQGLSGPSVDTGVPPISQSQPSDDTEKMPPPQTGSQFSVSKRPILPGINAPLSGVPLIPSKTLPLPAPYSGRGPVLPGINTPLRGNPTDEKPQQGLGNFASADPFGAMHDYWLNSPEHMYLQQGKEQRDQSEAPLQDPGKAFIEGAKQGMQTGGGLGNAGSSLALGLVQGGKAALDNTGIGRNIEHGVEDFFETAKEMTLSAANAPILNGKSVSEYLTPAIVTPLSYLNAIPTAMSGNLLDPGTATEVTNDIFGVVNMIVTKGASLGKPIDASIAQTQQARKDVAAAAQSNPQAKLALRAIDISGDSVESALDNITHKSQKIQDLEQRANAIQTQDPIMAGELLRQAKELRGKSAVDMVNDTLNPWIEFAYDLALDPINWAGEGAVHGVDNVLGLATGWHFLPEANALAKAEKAMNITADEAVKNLNEALLGGNKLKSALAEGADRAQEVYKGLSAGKQGIGERIANATRILARTPREQGVSEYRVPLPGAHHHPLRRDRQERRHARD